MCVADVQSYRLTGCLSGTLWGDLSPPLATSSQAGDNVVEIHHTVVALSGAESLVVVDCETSNKSSVSLVKLA